MLESQIKSAVIHIHKWMVVSIYFPKSNLLRERCEERMKLIVSSLDDTHDNKFIYAFELCSNIEQYGLGDAKDFKNLKEFHDFLKHHPECFRFKYLLKEGKKQGDNVGEGIISVKFTKKSSEQSGNADIPKGVRFVVEDRKSQQERIKNQIQILKSQEAERQFLDKMYKQSNDYHVDTLVVEWADDINVNANKQSIKKIVIRSAFLNYEDYQMKDDREIDEMGIQKVLKALPKFQKLESLTIQWHKMSSARMINRVIEACKTLQLKSLNFDSLSNGFDDSCIKTINIAKTENKSFQIIEEINIFCNLCAEDNYFEESCCHFEHIKKDKRKTSINSKEWDIFIDQHKQINSIWIPHNREQDMKLLQKRPWKKLILGQFQEQEFQQQYWKKVEQYFQKKENSNKLTSLCLYKIKNIDEKVLQMMLSRNLQSLEYLMLNQCDKVTENGLSPLQNCKKLKYLNIRHSPLQTNKTVTCRFLSDLNSLQFLNIDNYSSAKDAFETYIKSNSFSSLKQFGVPRNKWISLVLLKWLSQKKSLTRLNLCSTSGYYQNLGQAASYIAKLQKLKVLNIRSTKFNMEHVRIMIENLKYLKKLNISDIQCQKTLNPNFYDQKWDKIKYPLADHKKKPYENLSNDEKEEFLMLLNNAQMSKLLPLIPRVTHLDMRNLGIDERPFSNLKLAPSLRYIGCEYKLQQKLKRLSRREITFV